MNLRPARPTQASFARALLDPAALPPAGLQAWNGSDPGRRFDIYRNNVVSSLIAALADTFPVLQQLVGADFFVAMARLYVCEAPPDSPVLSEYGDGFAAWVRHFEPATTLPYLADVARLERARVRACHAADAAPVPPERWHALLADPGRLGACVLALHPSLTVLPCTHAAVSLWQAHQHAEPARIDAALALVDVDHPEQALVWREGDDVFVRGVDARTATLAAALQAGQTLGNAAVAVPGCDLAGTLGLLLQHALITDFQCPGDAP